jgi:hypothetical protein
MGGLVGSTITADAIVTGEVAQTPALKAVLAMILTSVFLLSSVMWPSREEKLVGQGRGLLPPQAPERREGTALVRRSLPERRCGLTLQEL